MSFIGNGVGRQIVMPGQIQPGAVTYSNLDTSVTAPLQGKNAIINSNFDFWQRGTSMGSPLAGGVTYMADRWAGTSTGTTYQTSRQAFTRGQTEVPGNPTYFHRAVIVSSAGAGNYAQLVQPIEFVSTFSGQNVTISFWAKADSAKPMSTSFLQFMSSGGGSSSHVRTPVGKVNLTSSWQKFTITKALPSIVGKTINGGDDSLRLEFWFDAGSTFNSDTYTLGQQSGTFDIAQVQVEVGTQATQFEYRTLHTEFALCQRYFQQGRWRFLTAGTGNYCGGAMRLNVQMRANPTMQFFDDVWTLNKYSTSGQGNNQNTVTGGNVVFGSLHTLESDFLFSTAPGNWLAFNWQASSELW